MGLTASGNTVFTYQMYNKPYSVDLCKLFLEDVSSDDLKGTKRLLRILDYRSQHFGEGCVRVGTVHGTHKFYLVLEKDFQIGAEDITYFRGCPSQLAWVTIGILARDAARDKYLNGIREQFRADGFVPSRVVDI